MSYHFIPDRMYRMPTHFGPVTGPRSDERGSRFDWSEMEVSNVSVTLQSDISAIDTVLPPGFSRLGDPTVTIAFGYMRNLPWLAGRGYNILGARINTKYQDQVGELLLVLWENLADPIITGREELGVNKIYCEIADLRRSGDNLWCNASWLGYHFCSLSISQLKECSPPEVNSQTKGQLLHYKYIPKTEQWGRADVQQVTLTPPVQGGSILKSETGEATLSWAEPRLRTY